MTPLKPFIKFIKGKKPLDIGTELDDYLSIDGITTATYQKVYADNMVMANKFDILMVMDGAPNTTSYAQVRFRLACQPCEFYLPPINGSLGSNKVSWSASRSAFN